MSKEQLLDKLESMSPEQLSQISPEERAEITSILQAPEETAGSEEETDILGTIKAGSMGTIHGATAGLSDEILAGVDTATETLSNAYDMYEREGMKGLTEFTPTIAETYQKKQKAYEDAIHQAQLEHPTAFLAGDIVGSIFGVGKIMGASKVGAKLGIIAAEGFVHGVGRSESETIFDVENMLIEGAKGAGLGVAGHTVGKVAFKGAVALTKKVRTSSFVRFLGEDMQKVKESLGKRSVRDWAERMLSYTDDQGKSLINGTTSREKMLEIIEGARQVEGDKLGKILINAQEFSGLKKSGVPLYDSIISSIDELGESAILSEQRTFAVLKAELKNTLNLKTNKITDKEILAFYGKPLEVLEEGAEVSLTRLHKFSSTVGAKIDDIADDYAASATDRKLLPHLIKLKKKIEQEIDIDIDFIRTSTKKDFSQALGVQFQKYGDLREASKAIKQRLKADNGQGFIKKMFNQSTLAVTSLGAAASASLGLPLTGPIIALGGLKAIKDSKVVNSVLSKSAHRMSIIIKSNPEKYEKIASRLVNSGTISGEAFMEDFALASAELDLMDRPLERTTDEVFRRSDSILTFLEKRNPEMAESLREAIGKRDRAAVSGLMSTLAMESDKIQEGIGWDGMAITEQDQQAVGSWISRIKSPRKRMKIKSQFNKNSMIPEEMIMGSEGQEPDKFFEYEKVRKGPNNNKY